MCLMQNLCKQLLHTVDTQTCTAALQVAAETLHKLIMLLDLQLFGNRLQPWQVESGVWKSWRLADMTNFFISHMQLERRNIG